MTLDRIINPPFQSIQEVYIPAVKTIVLANGIPVHIIKAGEQPILKIEVSFEAGNWQDSENEASFFTAKMLSEGTANYNSAQISSFFDQYGAFTEFGHGLDRANMTLYGLTKYLPSLLPMVVEILQESVFPQQELDTFKTIQLQTLSVNSAKNSFIANREFRKTIFEKGHPYGNSMTEEIINNIDRQTLLSFYQNNWQGKKCTIFISGNISDTEVALIDKYFGSISLSAKLPQQSFSSQLINDGQSMVIEKPEAIQSSIRMGKKLMNRKNPDYFSMLVLNELLGGYFGSRLMKNIREEKGLTYGISSNVAAFTHAGYFVIGTDVKKEFTQQTIDEIHKEIIILQTQLVEDSELQTVKNYMVGSFAGSLNTPFDIADRYKVILLDELPTNFYQNYITNIQSVTAQKVIEMANKYLAIDSLTEVVVGGK